MHNLVPLALLRIGVDDGLERGAMILLNLEGLLKELHGAAQLAEFATNGAELVIHLDKFAMLELVLMLELQGLKHLGGLLEFIVLVEQVSKTTQGLHIR